MIKTESLKFSYQKNTSFHFPDIHCERKDVLLITGNSGTGKTTFLHILSGLLKPEFGNVFIDDYKLYNIPKNELDRFRGSNIGIVFQTPYFISSLSAIDNVVVASYFAENKRKYTEALYLLSKLGIDAQAHHLPSSLSAGQKQRLSIARALINKPKVILADEPTSNLDDNNCQIVSRLLSDCANEYNASLVMVTHDNRLKNIYDNQINLQ